MWDDKDQAEQTETSYSRRNKENDFKKIFKQNLTHILREFWEGIASSRLKQDAMKKEQNKEPLAMKNIAGKI